jgi:hypothetical protein
MPNHTPVLRGEAAPSPARPSPDALSTLTTRSSTHARSIVSQLVLLVAVVVDVGAEVVAIVAILVNVSVVDVHVGRMCVAHSPTRASLAARTTPVTLVTGAGLFDQPRPDYIG